MLQELVNYQRSIEAALHQGWQKEQSGLGKFCGVAGTKPRPQGCDRLREGMLREDSAYEMYAGYRTAIKAVSHFWKHFVHPSIVCVEMTGRSNGGFSYIHTGGAHIQLDALIKPTCGISSTPIYALQWLLLLSAHRQR